MQIGVAFLQPRTQLCWHQSWHAGIARLPCDTSVSRSGHTAHRGLQDPPEPTPRTLEPLAELAMVALACNLTCSRKFRTSETTSGGGGGDVWLGLQHLQPQLGLLDVRSHGNALRVELGKVCPGPGQEPLALLHLDDDRQTCVASLAPTSGPCMPSMADKVRSNSPARWGLGKGAILMSPSQDSCVPVNGVADLALQADEIAAELEATWLTEGAVDARSGPTHLGSRAIPCASWFQTQIRHWRLRVSSRGSLTPNSNGVRQS